MAEAAISGIASAVESGLRFIIETPLVEALGQGGTPELIAPIEAASFAGKQDACQKKFVMGIKVLQKSPLRFGCQV